MPRKTLFAKFSVSALSILPALLLVLIASAVAADQKAQTKFDSASASAPPAADPVSLNITEVTCNPCTGANPVFAVKWNTSVEPTHIKTVKISGYKLQAKVTSCGTTSTCAGKSATASAPASATSANVTVNCTRVDGCNYSVIVAVNYTEAGVSKTFKASKTGLFPQIN